jgi:putative ABC transport system permease protein
MFKLNLCIALRSLWKHKGYTLINVGGLALGLASCMLLLLYVAYEWGYDKQFKNYETTYVTYNNQTANGTIFSFNATPGVLAEAIKAEIPGVEHAVHVSYPDERLLTYNRNSFKKTALFTESDFFKIFDFKVLKGNPAALLKNPDGVVLSQSMAKALFGNEDPVNKIIKLDNTENLKVEGVVADAPKNCSIGFDYLLSWSMFEKVNPWAKGTIWGSNFCTTFVQLKDNSFFDKANTQIHGMIKAKEKGSNGEPFLHPLSKWHLYSTFEGGKSVGGKIQQLQIFFMLAFCILLIACVNFMNLSTARSEKRSKEVGIRKAIGSSRKDLIRQFLMESVLLSLISMVFAFILLEIALPYFNGLLGITLVIEYSSWQFWTVLLLLALFTGIIAGSYPAFYLSSFDPIKVLKGFTLAGNSSLSIRKFLVVFQFVFAACLIICITVIYQQLNYIKNKSIGYDKNNLVELPVQGNLNNGEKFKLLKEELLKSGYVSQVANFSTNITEGGNNGYDVQWPGKDPNDKVLINFRFTGYDLIKTMGMDLVSGRDFSIRHADSTSVMINEALAKIMGMKDPVGKVIKWGKPVTIVGVIKDYVVGSPYQRASPMLIGYTSETNTNILIRIAANQNLSRAIQVIDDKVKEINPDFPVDRHFVDDRFEMKFQNEKLLGTISNWFGGFAVFISCLGLLGLALYMAEQRKREISIRKVLGADSLNILILLNADFIKLVLIANLIAFPLGYVIVNKWLSGYDFRIGISVLPFAVAFLLSMLIALFTVSIQSVKVARANPVDALKYE